MATKFALDQRAKVETGFSDRRSIAFRLSRRTAWIGVVVGMCGMFLLDFAIGDRIWVSPAYLSLIALAAWSLGWRPALGVIAACVIATVTLHDSSLYPYRDAITPLDFILRIPPVLAIIALLAHARAACEREWRLARTDPLTGALNRKAFFEMAGAIETAQGWHVLAYADLDGLKRVNDARGHQFGDESLKAFAVHVRAAIRKDDVFARIGGDEFLVYMAVRDAQAGLTVANRLHQAMNTATVGFPDELKCSVGALILAPGSRSIDRELRIADELMYEAKQTGAALTVATAREHDGKLTTKGRWMKTGTMPEDIPSEREFRTAPRTAIELAAGNGIPPLPSKDAA